MVLTLVPPTSPIPAETRPSSHGCPNLKLPARNWPTVVRFTGLAPDPGNKQGALGDFMATWQTGWGVGLCLTGSCYKTPRKGMVVKNTPCCLVLANKIVILIPSITCLGSDPWLGSDVACPLGHSRSLYSCRCSREHPPRRTPRYRCLCQQTPIILGTSGLEKGIQRARKTA